MTQEEMLKTMRENAEKFQNTFIDNLLKDVEFLNEKANRKGYEATVHEKMQFDKIANIIENMKRWF